MSICGYRAAYSTEKCTNTVPCPEHKDIKCVVCGEQATHECEYSGQFVCGAPLCDSCEGYEDTDKPGGAWGFLNHSHRMKIKGE